jgi:hypothetical protein
MRPRSDFVVSSRIRGHGFAGRQVPADSWPGKSSFDLEAGERVVDASVAPELMSLRVDGPRGSYEISEGEIFAFQSPKRFIARRQDARVGAFTPGLYAFYSPAPWTEDATKADETLVAWVEAKGSGRDVVARGVLPRLKLGALPAERCDHRFIYGWENFVPLEAK